MTEFGAAIAPSSLKRLSQAELVTLARQGSVEAIAMLMNRSLQIRGVTAQLTLQGDYLQVVLEAPLCPSENLVPGLRKGMAALASPAIRRMGIYGKCSGSEHPSWSRNIVLTHDLDVPGMEHFPHPDEVDTDAVEVELSRPQRRIVQPMNSNPPIAGRYQLQALVQQDGLVQVFAAEDLETGQPMVVKTLAYRNVEHWHQVEQFEREGRLLSQLRHPGIASCVCLVSEDSRGDRVIHLVHPAMGGVSCAELVEAGWRTNEIGIRHIAIQALEILHYLHTLRPLVIHCNVNPETLILHSAVPVGQMGSGVDRVSLTGFETAWDGSDPTFVPEATLECDYVAPEVMQGQPLPSSDLFGLGNTLLFLLTHQSPLELPRHQEQLDLADLNLSPGFTAWLEKMVHPDAAHRFPSAMAALTSLRYGGVFRGGKRMPAWKAIAGMTAASVALIPLYLNRYTLLDRFGLMEPFSQSMEQSAMAGNGDAIRTLLRHGGDATELLYRVETAAAVHELVKQGGQVNARHDQDGRSPLHAAVEAGRIDAATALLSQKANVNAVDRQGHTPLDRVLQRALTVGGKVDREAIALLVAHSATIRQRYLQAAIAADRRDLMGLLVPDGNLEQRDPQGRTALSYATAVGSQRIVESFIARGADIHTRDHKGQTPLHLATAHGQQEVMKILLITGANLHATTRDGFTPLHLAAARGDEEIAQWLTIQGADVNVESNEGLTPLHFAAAGGHREVVQMLLSKGADAKARDRQGKTAVDWARGNRHWSMVDLLQLYGG